MNKQSATGDFEIDSAEAERRFVAVLEELQELEDHERQEALADWVRSDWFSGVGFMLEGWQGELHREAWRCHRAKLEAPSPGKTWYGADHQVGRSTIHRLLDIEGSERALYASHPFRLIWTQEDEPWVAGAVGCWPLLDVEMLMSWEHLDIRHVILWNPKTEETRLLGDDNRAHLILPAPAPDVLDVFTDTHAFFRAWSRQRLAFASMMKLHGLGESRDGHLPGALVIGGIDNVHFPLHAAGKLVARPPLSRNALRAAIIKSANLPKIEEARVGHG